MITKLLSIELRGRGINVISLHPGWVKTPMTADENAPLEPVVSIEGMISVIESLHILDTGKIFDWKGNEIPW
jgi:NAD(P)-dependent dehydrogenase (short-subunit alcohol dehydrogenase family)